MLGDDVQRRVRQEVVDVGDPAGDRVVDRDHRQVGVAALDGGEDVLERRARHGLPVGVVLQADLVGVGARLALVGDASRCRSPAQSRVGGVVRPRRVSASGRPGRARPSRAVWRCARTPSPRRRPRRPARGRARPAQEVAALRAETAGALRHLASCATTRSATSGGRLSWSLALLDDERRRGRADLDPRAQRGPQLRQGDRRLGLRAAALAGGASAVGRAPALSRSTPREARSSRASRAAPVPASARR